MANMRADAQKANKEKEKKDLLKIGGGTKTVSNPTKTTQNIKPTNTGKSGKTNKTGNSSKGGKIGNSGKKTTTTQTSKGNKPQTSAVKAATTPPEKKKTTPKTTTNTGHVKALLGGSTVNMRQDAQKANTLKNQLKTGGSYKTATKPAQTALKEKKQSKKPSLNQEQWESQAKEALKSLPKMPNIYQTEKQNRTFRPGKSKTPGILTPESKAQREGRQKLITEPYTDLQLNAQQKGLKKSLQQVNDQLASGYYAPGSAEEAKANQQRKHWKEQLADVENQIEDRKQAKHNQQNQSRAALMASEGKRDADYQATLQTGADTAKKLNNVMADRNRGQQIAKYIADPSYKTYLNQYRLTRASDVTAEEMRNLEYMTQEEKDTALYYAGKGDWQQIADYYDLLKRDLNARRRQTESQKRQNFANEHKVLGGLANIASGTLTPMAAAATLGQAAKNKITGQNIPADPNSDWYMGPQIQGDTAQGITRDMSTGGRIAAQTALGLGQMAATLPMGGAALPMMGLQGAGNSGYQALQNGASTGNAARNAIASGILNYVSAKLPVERLLKTVGGQVTPNTIKGILANAGLMASTDGATQIAETLTDMAINGRRSAYNQYVNELTASGYSTEAAKRQANLQFFVKDIAETMAVSGLTGGLLGAGAELHGRRLQTAREVEIVRGLAELLDKAAGKNRNAADDLPSSLRNRRNPNDTNELRQNNLQDSNIGFKKENENPKNRDRGALDEIELALRDENVQRKLKALQEEEAQQKQRSDAENPAEAEEKQFLPAYGEELPLASKEKTAEERTAAFKKELDRVPEEDRELYERIIEELEDAWSEIEVEDLLPPYPRRKESEQASVLTRAGEETMISSAYFGKRPENTTDDSGFITSDHKPSERLWAGGENQKHFTLDSVSMDGKPYEITLPKKTYAEMVGRLRGEKLDILRGFLDEAIKKAKFVGSGSEGMGVDFNEKATRYDYFETKIRYNGQDYVLRFQVENATNRPQRWLRADEKHLKFEKTAEIVRIDFDKATGRSKEKHYGLKNYDEKAADIIQCRESYLKRPAEEEAPFMKAELPAYEEDAARAEQGDGNRLLPTAADEEAPFMAADAANGKRTYRDGKWSWEPDDDTTPGFGEPENQVRETETPEVPFLDPSKPREGELRTYEEDVTKAEQNTAENRSEPSFEDTETELERGETLQDTPSQEAELPTYEQDELNQKKKKIRQQNFGESDPETLQAVKDNEAEINFTPREDWGFDDHHAIGIQGKRLGSLLHSAYSMTLGRVLDRVSGNNKALRKYMHDKIERPLLDAKNRFAHDTKDQLDTYYQDMKRLGIKKGSKESAAVQWFGEGERLNRETGELEPYTLDDLKREFPKKWQDIQEADSVNRALYDSYIKRVNDVLEVIYPNVEEKARDQLQRLEAKYELSNYDEGLQNLNDALNALYNLDRPLTDAESKQLANLEAEIHTMQADAKDAAAEIQLLKDKIGSGEIYRGKRLFPRKDYYHHFKEFESGFAGLKNLFKGDFDIDPELVGVSDHTLPNSKWAAWLQRRTGVDRTDDSVAGVLKYIQEAEYKIAFDPIIAQYRTVVRDIARGTKDTRNANKFIEWMTDYTNDLAGKTNPIDRPFQKITSRKFTKGIMWLNNRVKSNAVMGNLSSAVSQVYNLPNLLGYIKNPIDIANGIRDYAKYKIANDGDAFQAIDSSGFITERYLGNYVDKFDSGILAKPEKFAAWLLEVGDKSVAEAGWFMAYDQGVRKGVEDPVMYADDIVRRSVGGRGVGEIPIAFKSNIVKLVAPFQIEVNNAYQVLREKVGKKDAIGIIMILGSTFLMNEIRENYIDGRRTGMDLINATIDGLDAAEDKKSPVGKVGMVAGRLGGEFLGNIPFGDKIANTLMNNKKLSEDFFGTNDFSRMGTGPIGISTIVEPVLKYLNGDNADFADPALKILLPYGGAQAARSKNALEDLGIIPKIRANQDDGFVYTQKEGSYDDDGNLKYPLDSKDPVDFLTATLMGSTATRGGKEYANEDYASLNKDQTKAYEKLVSAGLDQMTSWHKIKELAKIQGDKDEDGDTIQGSRANNQSTYLLDSGLSTSDQAKIYFAVVADEYAQNRKAYLAKNGVNESDYYRFLMNTRNTVGDQNENGDTISGSLEKNKLKELEKMKLNDQQKAAIYFTDFASDAHKEQLEKLEKRDVSAATYYRYMCDTMDIAKAVSKDGKTYNYSDMIRKLKYLEDKKYNKETAAKLLYFDLNSDSYIVKAYDENADKIREKGVGGYDFLKFLTISNAVSAEKDKNGKTINGSKRKKVLAFIDSMDISKSAKDALYYAADYKQKTIKSAPWHSGANWSKYIPTFPYLADDYQDGEKKNGSSADYGNAVSFGGGETSSVGAELKAGDGTSGGSYYGSSSGYSRKGRKSRKKSSGRRRSGRRSSGRSSSGSNSAAANQLLRASQAMNLVNGQFDSSGYVSRVKNLMTNLGIDASNDQVPELINVLGGLTAAQKQEIYSGVGGTNAVSFDDGLTTGGGDGSLLSSLGSGGNYLPRGEDADADDSLLKRLSKIKYAK